MSNYILTPNMNLSNPVPGVDPGPDYADNISNSFNVIDQHTHTAGSGVPITSNAININFDLPFNGNNATTLRTVRFSPQVSNPSLASDIGCLYEVGVDLWYNDGAGNQIKLTAGGTVNATSSGISSGTATASFVGGVLVVNSNTNTPANIQGGSILLGNNVANSKYLTLSPPSAMAANFQIVLPSLPGSTLPIFLDASGNMGTSGQVGTPSIANGAVTRPKLAALGQQVSSSCGVFSTGADFPVDVTNLTVTITTTGRPVLIMLQDDGTLNANGSFIGISAGGNSSSVYAFFRGVTQITNYYLNNINSPNNLIYSTPSSAVQFIDTPTAGTYTYKLSIGKTPGSDPVSSQIYNSVLVAYEIG